MTVDYNEKLYEDYTKIKRKVERGMLPLVARNPAIDHATTDYVVALAEHYHADKDAGKNPPIPLKNAAMLDRFSDLVMYEELKWSHPDKMSIVEYPVMSDTQEEERHDDEVSLKWAESVATDGRDYAKQTREYRRKLRNL